MKTIIPLVIALAVGCATGVAVRDLVAPARAQGQGGPNYEYTTVQVADPDQDKDGDVLKTYGQQGWLLVAVSPYHGKIPHLGGAHSLYFARPLPK